MVRKLGRQEARFLVEMDKLTSLNFLNFILKDQGDSCAQGNKKQQMVYIFTLHHVFTTQNRQPHSQYEDPD